MRDVHRITGRKMTGKPYIQFLENSGSRLKIDSEQIPDLTTFIRLICIFYCINGEQ